MKINKSFWMFWSALFIVLLSGCAISGNITPSKGTDRAEGCKLMAHQGRQNTKVIVFVHGFMGDCQDTWGQFPALLMDDQELASFDVYLWGYPTGVLGKKPPVSRVGQQLKTDLNNLLKSYQEIYLIGHSLGGLVIRSMVIDELETGHAQDLKRIRHIIFFGSPLKGIDLPMLVRIIKSEYADIDFQSDRMDELQIKWNQSVYKPTITSGDKNYKLKIPFTPVIGLSDELIPEKSARDMYPDIAETVPGTHVTMKLPPDRNHSSYQLVKRRLLEPTKWEKINVRGEGDSKDWNKSEFGNVDWRDIYWLTPKEGWLCGSIREGGGSEDIGIGILVHTIDGGVEWVQQSDIDSGQGQYNFGPSGNRIYSWAEAGPLNSLLMRKKFTGGKKYTVEGLLAAKSGIYFSEGGMKWKRITPLPTLNFGKHKYVEFMRIAVIENFNEIYASGWQGITHGYTNGFWEVQYPTYTYPIMSVSLIGGSEGRSVWAAGVAEPYGAGAIYRLIWPKNTWEKVPLTGINLQPGDTFRDVMAIDDKTVIAVGEKGLILRGLSTENGEWAWEQLTCQTKESLNSIAYSNGVLWIVGSNGLIIFSADKGNNWSAMSQVRDDSGSGIELKRIRFSGNTGWIVGNGVVLKSVEY